MAPPTASPITQDLERTMDELAWAIAADGIARHESAVARAVALLRAAGHRSALLDLVADQREPPVARERAFGRLPRRASTRPGDPRLVAA